MGRARDGIVIDLSPTERQYVDWIDREAQRAKAQNQLVRVGPGEWRVLLPVFLRAYAGENKSARKVA